MLVDLANLEWWQTLIGIAVGLGLSPAPWLLGMAFGRIQFSAPARATYDERVADLKAQHADAVKALTTYHAEVLTERDGRYAELKQSRDYYREARIVERDRADKVTDQLAEALELARLNTHLLQSLDEATKAFASNQLGSAPLEPPGR